MYINLGKPGWKEVETEGIITDLFDDYDIEIYDANDGYDGGVVFILPNGWRVLISGGNCGGYGCIETYVCPPEPKVIGK